MDLKVVCLLSVLGVHILFLVCCNNSGLSVCAFEGCPIESLHIGYPSFEGSPHLDQETQSLVCNLQFTLASWSELLIGACLCTASANLLLLCPSVITPYHTPSMRAYDLKKMYTEEPEKAKTDLCSTI